MAQVRVRHPFSPLGSLLSLSGLLPFAGVATAVSGNWILGILVGATLFLSYRLVIVPATFLAAHRRGVRQAREGQLDWALEAFRDSEAIFRAYPWADRYRWLVLASGLPMSYATLSRYNQAWCLAHLDRKPEALAVLAQVEAEAPTLPDLPELRRFIDAIEDRPPPLPNWI